MSYFKPGTVTTWPGFLLIFAGESWPFLRAALPVPPIRGARCTAEVRRVARKQRQCRGFEKGFECQYPLVSVHTEYPSGSFHFLIYMWHFHFWLFFSSLHVKIHSMGGGYRKIWWNSWLLQRRADFLRRSSTHQLTTLTPCTKLSSLCPTKVKRISYVFSMSYVIHYWFTYVNSTVVQRSRAAWGNASLEKRTPSRLW